MSRFTHFLRQYFGEQSCYKAILDFMQLCCHQIRTLLCMFKFRFGYGHLRSNFWIVSNSARQDLALLEFVWTFRKFQFRSLVSVCLFDVPFHVVYFEAYFSPFSRSQLSKNFRDLESLGKSAEKKWSQNWTFLLGCGLKLPRKKKFVFCWFCHTKHGGNHASRWITDLWSKSISLFRFSILDYFFPFLILLGFLCILGPPYCGIGATIRIGREIRCLPYAGFFLGIFNLCKFSLI